jgi:hypothetical protein
MWPVPGRKSYERTGSAFEADVAADKAKEQWAKEHATNPRMKRNKNRRPLP